MKFKLKDIVLDYHPAHAAIGYAMGKTLTKTVKDLAGTEELHEKELDIQLLIDGEEYDLKKFFQSLSDNYFEYLGSRVKAVLFKEAEDTINRLQSSLHEIETKLDSINEDISYDMKLIDFDKLIGK
jgi:hypothetical protein